MKVGIIGCGKIAQVRHIPEYCGNGHAEIAGYYDFNMERAKGLAGQFGGKAYGSVEELLADGGIDAVSVCVSNHAHAEITIKALRAGKHVLCEKPMAVTLADCIEMAEEARKAGKLLMIGQNQRFAKAHVRAKQLIQEGAIGDVITFKTNFGHGGPETWSIDPGANSWFFDKEKAVMGAMADLGIHKTDLIQYLLGSRIVETTAKVVTLDKRDASGSLIGVDDNAICIYQMENGVLGTMTASWTYYGAEDNSTVLYGKEGIMKLYDDPDYSITILTKDGDRILYDIDKIQTNDNQTKSGIIDEFVEAAMEGRSSAVDGSDVLNAMRAVFASIESSEKGVTVKVTRGAA